MVMKRPPATSNAPAGASRLFWLPWRGGSRPVAMFSVKLPHISEAAAAIRLTSMFAPPCPVSRP